MFAKLWIFTAANSLDLSKVLVKGVFKCNQQKIKSQAVDAIVTVFI